jgi:hypothetical protein
MLPSRIKVGKLCAIYFIFEFMIYSSEKDNNAKDNGHYSEAQCRDYVLNLPFSNGECDYACLLNRHAYIILQNFLKMYFFLFSCFKH